MIFDSPHHAESDRDRFQPGLSRTTNPPTLACDGIPRISIKSSVNDQVTVWRSSPSTFATQPFGAEAPTTLGPQNPIEKSRSRPTSDGARLLTEIRMIRSAPIESQK